ncbi:MAG: hypothetical protein WAX38_03530 [Minisyncoccia bacterium]
MTIPVLKPRYVVTKKARTAPAVLLVRVRIPISLTMTHEGLADLFRDITKHVEECVPVSGVNLLAKPKPAE